MIYEKFIFFGTLGCLLTICVAWFVVESDWGYRKFFK